MFSVAVVCMVSGQAQGTFEQVVTFESLGFNTPE